MSSSHKKYKVLSLDSNSERAKQYRVGDIYQAKSYSTEVWEFNGLKIVKIDYLWDTIRLHFDWNEWVSNSWYPAYKKHISDRDKKILNNSK